MHAQPRKRAEWLDLVVMLEESGTKAREFSAQRGLNAKTLEWWRARFRREGVIAAKGPASRRLRARHHAAVQMSRVRLARVTVTSTTPPAEAVGAEDTPGVTLEVGRVRVLVRRGFHRATLASVLAVLGVEEAR
jgi:hypothetical protein